jgi:rubrerythrin
MAASRPAKRLNIRQLTRVQADGKEEALTFHPGVNLIVGPPNTGKSKWLRTLDFLFGEPDSAEEKLGPRYTAKYVAARASLTVGEREVTLERRWGRGQQRSKTFIDGEGVSPDEFTDVFLPLLDLPVLRFPTGNPYAPRAWPRLSWRLLYRHIYRHEFGWGDIVTKQPEAEQFACLMMFLGAAERLFPPSYGDMVAKQRDVEQLRARKDQYVSTLEDVTRELLAVKETSVALTDESLDAATARLREEISAREGERAALLESLQATASAQVDAKDTEQRAAFAKIGERLAERRIAQEAAAQRLAAGRERQADLVRNRQLVVDELAKLERTRAAREELADLRITHCPNCDQRVTRAAPPDQCRLCLQPYPEREDDADANVQRLLFEVQQLASEARELDELLAELEEEREAELRMLHDINDEIAALDAELRPVRSASSWILPPELGSIDQARGRLEEQLRQVERIRAALGRRGELSQRIDALDQEIGTLDTAVRAQRSTVKFAQTSEVLADGMNSYLNALNAGGDVPRWRGGRVDVRIRDRDVEFTLSGRDWRGEVGGTYTFLFLFAYQYALLQLSATPGAAYPGFAIIDLPPNVSDNRVLTTEENYLAEPFVALLGRPVLANAQLILTGHAYAGLAGVHRVDLGEVFESVPDDE